jgi:outer membrane lipoprotein-sorting protein
VKGSGGRSHAQPSFGQARVSRSCGGGMHGLGKCRPPLALALWVCAICLLGLAGCGAGASMKRASLDSLIRDVETKSYLVQQFRARFEKTRRTGVFDRELSVKGSLIFQKPNKFQLSMSGDVNVEILSDGETITIIHDGKDQETYHVQGERDLSRFADPLMVLLQGIGNGGLRKFSVVRQGSDGQPVVLEAEPKGQLYFERTKKILLKLSESGEIRSVRLLYSDGDHDETVFHSWSMLPRNDPEIVKLNSRLKTLSRRRSPSSSETASGPIIPCHVRGASHAAIHAQTGESTLLGMLNPSAGASRTSPCDETRMTPVDQAVVAACSSP